MYLNNRFFAALGICIFLFALSYSFPIFMGIGKGLLVCVLALLIVDIVILMTIRDKIILERSIMPKISLGEYKELTYDIENQSSLPLSITVVDELPYQLQDRNFEKKINLRAREENSIKYEIRPVIRGAYSFGLVHVYYSIPWISLAELRIQRGEVTETKVIPSVEQMKKYELQVFSKTATLSGIRKVRRVGESDEFEHIKSYVQGDHIKSINWKATSRKNQIMVNEFQNSRSQMVYCIIDKGRAMKMPFNKMTLLDHAINSTLVMSNIVLKKYDKVGLVTFSDRIGSVIRAQSMRRQLEKIAQKLYDQKTDFKESNFELLFYTLRRQVSRRSILLFFTNFENEYDLNRNLPYLKSLQKKHLLVVIFFINTELIATSEMECETQSDVYLRTFARKALVEKEKIQRALNIQGIQTILTKPEELSINVINRYLEIKAKRMR